MYLIFVINLKKHSNVTIKLHSNSIILMHPYKYYKYMNMSLKHKLKFEHGAQTMSSGNIFSNIVFENYF